MKLVLVSFWTLIVFTSIAWYATLLFYVGYKGGKEIVRMAQVLRARAHDQEEAAEPT